MTLPPNCDPSVSISTYNASDMENFGDVLYPVLIERFLQREGLVAIDKNYAFLDGAVPLEGGYQVSGIRQLFSVIESTGRDVRLLVGGGDVLRTDDLTVAGHYLPEELQSGYVRQQAFARDHMPPHPGAFFVSPANCRRLLGAAFISCGVPFEIEVGDRADVRAAVESSSYVYVRDHQSREKLLRAGVTRPIEVAADIAIACAEYFPKSELAATCAPVIASSGLDLKHEYAVFQCSRAARDHLPLIASELAAYARQTGRQVVLLPLGPCHGDVETLQSINDLAGGALCCLPALSVLQMLAVVAHAHVFVGVSMHGNICARSYGVRHGFGVLPNVDKIAGAMHILEMQASQKIDQWDDLCAFMLRLEALSPDLMTTLSARLARDAGQQLGRAIQCLLACTPKSYLPVNPPEANDSGIGKDIGRNSPCRCGSGKRFKECCGSLQSRGVVSPGRESSDPQSLLQRALDAQLGGALSVAAALYARVLEIQPQQVDALHMLGVVYFQQQNFRRAVPFIFRALELTGWSIEFMRHNMALTLAPLFAPSTTSTVEHARLRNGIKPPPSLVASDGPRVSVLVPSFNHGTFVEEALRSIFAQTYRNIEIILIDDGSTDGSVEIIESLLKDSPFPYQAVYRGNRGAHATLNECAALASGVYLAPLNSDDVFAPDRVALMVWGLERSGLAWGFSQVTCINHQSRELASHEDARVTELLNIQRALLQSQPMSSAFLKCNPSISTGNLFVLASLFSKLGGFRDYRANHDWDFCLRASELSEPCFVDAALYRYRIHGANTISENASRNRLEADEILSQHLARAFDPLANFANVEALSCRNHRDEFIQSILSSGVARLLDAEMFRQTVTQVVRLETPTRLSMDRQGNGPASAAMT